ncbi:chaperone protein HtpG [Deltaproteobacteria bacterium]|nr:chaperone protein HtpG [Deltaproteobacteria bacterium]
MHGAALDGSGLVLIFTVIIVTEEVLMAETGKKNRQFRAEVRKVLNILTHSLYTNREIFLRELISNASDALDKLRFRANRSEQPSGGDMPLEIRITIDKDNKTFTIADTGVGMTADELAENLGTIAKSGSEEFLANLQSETAAGAAAGDAEKPDASNIVGRFGIGFYSVFMVADKVEVISTPAFGEERGAAVWSSDGLGAYSIKSAGSDAPARGTVVKAHIKDDAVEFLEKFRVESAVRNHSAFMPFPIFLDGERINPEPALWREPKFSIKKEQYEAFYKALTYDAKAPMDVLHLSVDAPVQFNALLYIPDSKQDFFGVDRDFWGIDLYARRVLIQRRNKELIPEYLAFFKGVTDTEDLPLNISRETLQENVLLRKINQVIVKQVLGHLEKMEKDNRETYLRFWRLHGKIFKLGYNDFPNRERVSALLRFNSSALDDDEALTSLAEYMSRAPAEQKIFWYVSAPNREAVCLNPHMEIFRKKGIEVLYLFEPVDEFVMEGLGKYKEWDFKPVENATDDALAAFDDRKDASQASQQASAPLSGEEQEDFDKLLAKMKEILNDKVKEVRVSRRLDDSPSVLVSPDGAMASSMEKLLKVMHKDDTLPVKVLEVNQNHPLLRGMLKIFKADPEDAMLALMTQGLFDTSLLLDGYAREPQALASRVNALLKETAALYADGRAIPR